ncbi:Extracellular membrane protein, 8-cysteine region, CFEM [Metarhizium robertsii ARSEF 23]|uniref:Extracellular membrane protein, 8-cysteine region, CFEM n=1 Tax=Metarhizium robertsii (strain ARSEF 23 / ATCC MYA-3075) TaxID=655844 RepID=E9F701_METRA|nr:Extracellular membrane protein, 8-cysteine region, CFEM [Metarhizium robertsii ARSEF 23]EFY96553.2 Extracellular membrane protein, 8-cysteine region, CFEM [Metarhizium robertsii ARSEF 23]
MNINTSLSRVSIFHKHDQIDGASHSSATVVKSAGCIGASSRFLLRHHIKTTNLCFSNSTCSIADAACICATANYDLIQGLATPCILNSCSPPEALFTKNLTETACGHPTRDRSSEYSALAISVGVTSSIFVGVRIIYKVFFCHDNRLGYDDWAILMAFLVNVPSITINVHGLAAYGLGRDIWTLTPDDIITFIEFFLIDEVLYLAMVSLVKLSLSLFYLRIFPGTTIRRLLWATALFNVAFGIAFVTTAIFQCTPISYTWTQYIDHSLPGHCIDRNAWGWSNGALSIALDAWMILIPLSQVPRLRLHWKQKVGVAIMFFMGTL